MGNTPTKTAKDEAKNEEEELDHMLTVLSNKRDALLLRMKDDRGNADAVNKTEIAGGRTAARMS